MASRATKVYPVRNRTLAGVPAAVHVVPTQGDADALVASGAFTLNPKDAERDTDAVDLGDEPLTPVRLHAFGEAPPGAEPPADQGPADAGPSDSSEE